MIFLFFFFFKQKTAYEIGTGDWSSDVCSSDLKDRRSIYNHLSCDSTCKMMASNVIHSKLFAGLNTHTIEI